MSKVFIHLKLLKVFLILIESVLQEPDEGQRLREQQLRQHAFFQLRIHLKRGQNLVAMDKNGTSDPYVKFKAGGRLLHKSRIVHRDLNPVWDECFTVPIEDPFQPVQIKVFDYDWGLQDDFMGSCQLDLTALELGRTQDMVLCLHDPDKPTQDMGEIKMSEKDNKMGRLKNRFMKMQEKLQDRMEDIQDQVQSKFKEEIQKSKRFISHLSEERSSVEDNNSSIHSDTNSVDSLKLTENVIPSFVINEPDTMDPKELCKDFISIEKNCVLFRRSLSATNLAYNDDYDDTRSSSDSPRAGSLPGPQAVLPAAVNTCTEIIERIGNRFPRLKSEGNKFHRYLLKNTKLSDVNKRLKAQIWSSVVTIVLVEAKNLPAMDLDTRSSDPYCKFRCAIDLSALERERTHSMWKDLEDGNGSIFLLLTISGTTQSETITDLTSYKENKRDIEIIERRYVYGAKGLAAADLGGKSDPFCVLELGNARLQTHTEYKTLAPNWMKIFTLDCFEWESRLLSGFGVMVWLAFCYYYEMWMMPFLLLVFFLRNWLIYRLTVDDEDLLAEEDDDEEGDKEEKKSLKERLQAIQEVTQTVQNAIGYVASLGEAVKKLVVTLLAQKIY
ncbi:putative transmembrane 1 protein [Operophtera brumata]|uniref:Putative transmembrane 1 protein n=1 Tax=Operophtera brumata TaxID=104452 RepID=A0A0L7KZP4_OPEBR|nr:putative transmembrane 1 protein [Operophtera brumata]